MKGLTNTGNFCTMPGSLKIEYVAIYGDLLHVKNCLNSPEVTP